MKKLLLYVTFFVSALFSCKQKTTEKKYEDTGPPDTIVPSSIVKAEPAKIDVGRGIFQSVVATDDVTNLIDELRLAQPSEYGMMLMENKNKWLPRHVTAYARQAKIIPMNQALDSVIYYFGSADAEVIDSSGESYNGRITDELVAFMYPMGLKIPIGVIVHSTNIVSPSLRDSLQRIGPLKSQFVIAKRRGINHYVDYQTSFALADYFEIPVYQGKVQDSTHRISVNFARTLNKDSVQVTMGVYPGDHFDLDLMKYSRAH